MKSADERLVFRSQNYKLQLKELLNNRSYLSFPRGLDLALCPLQVSCRTDHRANSLTVSLDIYTLNYEMTFNSLYFDLGCDFAKISRQT